MVADGTGTYRVGADIGGTFTDIVVVAPDGAFGTRKVLSTTDDYARGIVEGLRHLLADLGVEGAALGEIVHGTTVATNTILENKGAKTALLTTRGFRDVLELRRLRVPQLYDRYYVPPRPMVERRLRLEVDERLGASGEVVRALDEASLGPALDRIEREGAEAVAVCLLHSYRNPSHERRIGELVRERLPGAFLSLSVDVLPEIREYERTSTTVINAYIGPVVTAYIGSLTRQLADAGIGAELLIMQSNGGIMSAEAAARKPAHIVESGPAAGVIAAHEVGKRAGLPNLISFDMGGTTAKASIIEDGRTESDDRVRGWGRHLALQSPRQGRRPRPEAPGPRYRRSRRRRWQHRLDRSRRRAESGSAESAGAIPGPACHDTGGSEPTITDANVVLGYINPRYLAGGAVRLRADLAEAALAEKVAVPLGMSLAKAAYGVYAIANASMIRAIKAVSTYRGRDPRDFALLAFGGSGPDPRRRHRPRARGSAG